MHSAGWMPDLCQARRFSPPFRGQDFLGSKCTIIFTFLCWMVTILVLYSDSPHTPSQAPSRGPSPHTSPSNYTIHSKLCRLQTQWARTWEKETQVESWVLQDTLGDGLESKHLHHGTLVSLSSQIPRRVTLWSDTLQILWGKQRAVEGSDMRKLFLKWSDNRRKQCWNCNIASQR